MAGPPYQGTQVSPTYAPRTAFPTSGAPPPNDPSFRGGSPTWAGGGVPGKAPGGMSQLFWDTINESPEAEAIRRKKKENFGFGMSDADVRAEIDKLIMDSWSKLPEERRKTWTDQDERGSQNVPGSPGWAAEQEEADAKLAAEGGLADIEEWEGGVGNLGPLAQSAAMGDIDAIAKLEALVDSIKDPEIKEYVGDYISQAAQAGPSQQAKDNQQKEYERLSALTDPTITAEERFMMETARRQQEQDLRSQRGAFANDLQARGMYGSGAELTMNLAASQEAAQRRALEEMDAQSNAQNRAMKALTGANEAAGKIRGAEATEDQFRGTAADKAKEFNNTLREAYNKWRTEEEGRQAKAKVDRNSLITEYKTTANQNRFRNALSGANTALEGKKAKIDTRFKGHETVSMPRRELGRVFTFNKGVDDGLAT
jgi:hypothetical protein